MRSANPTFLSRSLRVALLGAAVACAVPSAFANPADDTEPPFVLPASAATQVEAWLHPLAMGAPVAAGWTLRDVQLQQTRIGLGLKSDSVSITDNPAAEKWIWLEDDARGPRVDCNDNPAELCRAIAAVVRDKDSSLWQARGSPAHLAHPFPHDAPAGYAPQAFRPQVWGWLALAALACGLFAQLRAHASRTLAAAASLVLLTRLPFLTPGLGLDEDNALVVRSASAWLRTGTYHRSRPPGFPVYEAIAASLAPSGPLALTFASAAASVVAFAAFASILKSVGVKSFVWIAFALVMTPILYLNSVAASDTLFALAFALLAWDCALRGQPIRAGLLLGLAVGCRATSAAFLLPVAASLVARVSGRRALGQFVVVTAISSCALYAAVFLDPLPLWPGRIASWDGNFAHIVRRATIGVWGYTGTAAVLGVLVAKFVTRSQHPHQKPNPLTLALVLTISLTLAAYLLMPSEAAYLIPTVPLVLALLALHLPNVWMRALSGLLVLSPFLLAWTRAGIQLAGPILIDHQQRQQQTACFQQLADGLDALPAQSLIVSGGMELGILAQHPELGAKDLDWRATIAPDELEREQRKQLPLYYLPTRKLVEEERRKFGLDLTESNLVPLILGPIPDELCFVPRL